MYLKNIIKKFIPWVDMSSKIYKWYLKSHGNELKGNKLLAGYYSYKIYKKYNCVISPKAKKLNIFVIKSANSADNRPFTLLISPLADFEPGGKLPGDTMGTL